MKWLYLVIFVVVTQTVGAFIGLSFPVNDWYASIVKSPLTPPGYVFGIVWPILYVMIAIAGWRTFVIKDRVVPRFLWSAQMLFNFAFNPSFFGLQNIPVAALTLFATLATALAFTLIVRPTDPISALLFIPYLLWLGFASYLITFIWVMN